MNDQYTSVSFLERLASERSKKLPQTIDMEEAVIGAVLIDRECFADVKEILNSNSFYDERHQLIFETFNTITEKGEFIDVLSVIKYLRINGKIQKAGGAKYIATLSNKVNSSVNVEFHAEVILQSNIKREMIEVANKILEEGFNDDTDALELLNKTELSFFEISEQNIRKNYLSAKDILSSTIVELENKKINNKEGVTGVSSGFRDLDSITGGWQKSELSIIAARPGMGKTAFVVSTMRNAAIDHGVPVAIFSLEMSATQLMLRMISSEAEIDSEKLRKGKLDTFDWEKMHQKGEKLSKSKIFIDDTPALSILELRAKCRRLKAQHDIGMVIIDYLQLMTGDDGSGISNSREQEIAAISRSLKNLAKELQVPVLALSQLSRAVEMRGGEDKRPQLSDLRESGSIEQDADMVMFLYRPEYYKVLEIDGVSTEGLGELIIAKNRAGVTDTIKLQFIGKYTKFCNYGEGFNFDDDVKKSTLFSNGGIAGFENASKSQSNQYFKSFTSKANNDNDAEPDLDFMNPKS